MSNIPFILSTLGQSKLITKLSNVTYPLTFLKYVLFAVLIFIPLSSNRSKNYLITLPSK